MAVTRVGIASQPFLYLDFGVICVFQTEIDTIGRRDNVVWASIVATACRVVNFFGVVSIGVVIWVHGLKCEIVILLFRSGCRLGRFFLGLGVVPQIISEDISISQILKPMPRLEYRK